MSEMRRVRHALKVFPLNALKSIKLSDIITQSQKLMLDMHFSGHMLVFHEVGVNFEVLGLKELRRQERSFGTFFYHLRIDCYFFSFL